MKNIKKKSIIAVGLTALSTFALGVGAIVLSNTKEEVSGFKGTYDFSAYAETSINQIIVGGKEIDITDTATFTSTDEAKTYTLCLTVVDMADFGKEFTAPLQVGYKIAEGGKYHNGSEVGLSGTVYSSLTFANGDKLAAADLTLGENFTEPYFVVAEVATSTVKLATPECIVGAETGFEIIDEHMDHVYLAHEPLDTANLVVNSLWSYSVGGEVTTVGKKLTSSDYTIGTTDMTTAGEKTVSITYGDYDAQTIDISVLDSTPTVTDSRANVNVNASYTGSNGGLVDGVHTFKSVKDAIDFYEKSNLDSSVHKIINVGEGVYEDKITTKLDNLVLIGAGSDKSVMTYSAVESTVDPVSGEEYGLKCATLHVKGAKFKAYNMTIRNDFDYINQAANYTSPQGVALTIDGDGAVIYNTHVYGNQDTLYLRSGRSYFYQSQIDGNVDFIFGNQTGLAYFEECTIMAINRAATDKGTPQNGFVTAAQHLTATKPDYGYIFDKCTLTDDGKVADGSMALGRPWGVAATVAYINCSFSAAYATSGYGSGNKTDRWCKMSGSPVDADFCEYGSTGDGAISEAVTGGKVLTAEQAANYTKANIFAATNGKQTAAKFDCDIEFTKLEILAGLKEGDLPAETTTTFNFADYEQSSKPESFFDGQVTVNSNYWLNGSAIRVYAGGTVIINEKGKIAVEWFGGSYGTSANGRITYKDGFATLTILDDSASTGGIYIKSITIDYTEIPEDTQFVTVTIDYNDGVTANDSIEATVGSTISKPEDPVRDGYTFAGWYNGETEYDFTSVVTEAITLTAHWTEGVQEVIFDTDTEINLLECETAYEKTSGVFKGIEIDATNGKFKNNGSGWIQFNTGTILKFKVAEGAVVTFVEYNNAGLITLSERDAEGYVTLTATGNTYIKTISISFPIDFTKNVTVNLTECTTKYEKTTGNYKGIEIDATNGKFAPNGSWVQFNAGTILKFKVAEGAVVTFVEYKNAGLITLSERDADGYVTLTATGNTYLKTITVSYSSAE